MTSAIYPCLWFDGNAKEAANFYCSIFKNSKIIDDTPMVVHFEINGSKIMGLNGGPAFKFNESFSFVVNCDDQAQIDDYWEKLTADGGKEGRCGWLKDKFGFSWQIIPANLGQIMSDPEKRQNRMQAMMKMGKFNIQELLSA